MLFTKWILPEGNPKNSALIRREYGVPAMVADILAARGLSAAATSELLEEEIGLEDPFLLPDMQEAVKRIEEALDENQRITVYGDYDCDGVTSTVILYSYLQSMGADVTWYIPERLDEGYGLNAGALEEIAGWGTKLLITVDNGISALKEVELAGELGMDVVITDHHQVGGDLPAAAAVVNPHRRDYRGSFPDLCGAGVALKLVAAMEGGEYEQVMESFGAFAAIGTVGDVVPLTGENRYLVKKGLELLEYNENLGLQALLEVTGMKGKPVTSQKVAFGLAPRINAAGRMGSAKLAVQLFLSEDPEEAAQLAEELNGMNARRQEEEEIILAKVEDAIAAHPEKKLDRVMVVAAEGLNHGVVGIVSAKVLGLYGKPNIILSVDGDTATGSARSVEFFSMFKAIHSCGGLLEKYGGHAMAAGLTLQTEKIPEFDRQINAYAARQHDQMPVVSQKIDKILHASDINVNDVSALEMLEPFGEGNPQPLFLLKNCVIEGIQPMSENRHLKLKVRFEEKSIYVLYFRMSTDRFIYPVGAAVDILANLELNTFRENVSIAVRLKDIRPAGFSDEKFGNALHYYQKIRRGEPVAEKILTISVPSLEELRGLYKLLRNRKGSKNHLDLFYVEAVASRMNYCKYRLILDIFEELGLISIPPDGSSISMEEVGKVDLESSRILTSLRQAGDSAGKGV